jgi:hypothetical protein
MEGMSVAFQKYCFDGQKKLVKLSTTKSREIVLTFSEFALPESCEAAIWYTVPIHTQDSGAKT